MLGTPPAEIGGRYQVIEPLGRGGTAQVYRVRERGARRDVALKQLVTRGKGSERTKAIELFEREFQALASIRWSTWMVAT